MNERSTQRPYGHIEHGPSLVGYLRSGFVLRAMVGDHWRVETNDGAFYATAEPSTARGLIEAGQIREYVPGIYVPA